VLQAYCKLIVALLAAGCVHGFHADMHTGTSYNHVAGARGPRRATGPRTTMICVQRRHSETEHLRPIPGRRDVRHSDIPIRRPPTPLGPQSMGAPRRTERQREARPTAV
jgi:hypothetical protein